MVKVHDYPSPKGKASKQGLHKKTIHGNCAMYFFSYPKPSFLGGITHILGCKTLHFSWFWGPRATTISWSPCFYRFFFMAFCRSGRWHFDGPIYLQKRHPNLRDTLKNMGGSEDCLSGSACSLAKKVMHAGFGYNHACKHMLFWLHFTLKRILMWYERPKKEV